MPYFKPFRRKLGVVTLLMACVFAIGWIRSQRTYDGIEIWHGNYKYSIRSMRNSMRWDHMFVAEGELAESLVLPFSFDFDPKTNWSPVDKLVENVQWQIVPGEAFIGRLEGQLAVDSFFAGTNGAPKRFTMFLATTPYWSIVLPLTLLSAWLLLSKPRPPVAKVPV